MTTLARGAIEAVDFHFGEFTSLWVQHLRIKQMQVFHMSRELSGHTYLIYEASFPSDIASFYFSRGIVNTLQSRSAQSSLLQFSFASHSQRKSKSHDINLLESFRHFDGALNALLSRDVIQRYLRGVGCALVFAFRRADSHLCVSAHDCRYAFRQVGITSTQTRVGFVSQSLD